MARRYKWLALAALLQEQQVAAAPAQPETCPTTVIITKQPYEILTQTPIYISTSILSSTEIVIGGHTITLTGGPTVINTVTTITNTGSSTDTTSSTKTAGPPGNSGGPSQTGPSGTGKPTGSNGSSQPTGKPTGKPTGGGGSSQPGGTSPTGGNGSSQPGGTSPTGMPTGGESTPGGTQPTGSPTGGNGSSQPGGTSPTGMPTGGESTPGGTQPTGSPTGGEGTPGGGTSPTDTPTGGESTPGGGTTPTDTPTGMPTGGESTPGGGTSPTDTPTGGESTPGGGTTPTDTPTGGESTPGGGTSPTDTPTGGESTPGGGTTPTDTPTGGESTPGGGTTPTDTPTGGESTPGGGTSPTDTPTGGESTPGGGTSPTDTPTGGETTPPVSTPTPTPTTCTPGVTATPSACATSLPKACNSLGNVNGLQLITEIPGCVLALGPFAVGTVSTCLATSGINLLSKGNSVVTCLLNALTDVCILKLPAQCVSLGGVAGLPSVTQLAQCTTQLGPFALGSAATCLAGTLSSGNDVVQCLLKALGLGDPDANGGGDNTCPVTTPPPLCVTSLPASCTALGTLTGLAIVPSLATCVTALGTNAVGDVLQCLDPAGILPTSAGSAVLSCVTKALKSGCPCVKNVPTACSSLSSLNGLAIVPNLAACVTSLGANAIGEANACLDPAKILPSSTGTGIVDCLVTALQSGCADGTPPPPPCNSAVPANCASLGSTNGLALVPKLAACTAALGIKGVAAATKCLNPGSINLGTKGASIVSCLTGALVGVCL